MMIDPTDANKSVSVAELRQSIERLIPVEAATHPNCVFEMSANDLLLVMENVQNLADRLEEAEQNRPWKRRLLEAYHKEKKRAEKAEREVAYWMERATALAATRGGKP